VQKRAPVAKESVRRQNKMSERATSRLDPTRMISILIANRAVFYVALIGLCAAYLQGGIDKLLDFSGAVTETARLGLNPALPLTVATIFTEITASVLILSGFYRWFGALWLAGFTLIATFVANRFWEFPQPDRFDIENSFFEHLGLVGGFILVAFYDVKNRISGNRP
jgi:uncharacterized membrane protein YphA (DoxX/SURF4 family)